MTKIKEPVPRQKSPVPLQLLKLLTFSLIFSFLWSLPCLFNNSPLFYYDSAFFIHTSLYGNLPPEVFWRPLTYGYLIGPLVYLSGFKLVILIQNLVAAFIITRYLFFQFGFSNFKGRKHKQTREDGDTDPILNFLKRILPEKVLKNSNRINTITTENFLIFITLTVLFFTPLVHYSNFIMTDFMAGLGLLTALMFFSIKTGERYLWFFATVIICLTHYTHFFIYLPVFWVGLSLKNRKKLTVILTVLTSVFCLHFAFMKPKTGFGRAVHYFVFSRFIDYNLVKPYLDRNCNHLKSPFCKAKNVPFFHIWKPIPDSIVESMGGNLKALPEIVKLNQNLVKDPHTMILFLKFSLTGFLKQLTLFARPLETLVHDPTIDFQLATHSLKSHENYKNARLFNNKTFDIQWFQSLQELIFFLLTTLSFSLLLIQKYRNKLPENLKGIFFQLNLCYVSHSLFCALFTAPMSRYNNRFVWIYTLLGLIYLNALILKKSRETGIPTNPQ